MKRRSFLRNSSIALVGAGGMKTLKPELRSAPSHSKLTLSLNAYSFTRPLLAGEMSLEELFRFAMETGFPAVDLTAYYIPEYPDVPEYKVLFDIKKLAFRHGIAISGTGVRNDFTLSDPDEHRKNIDLVKNWIKAASSLGAPHVRVFAGKGEEVITSREEVMDRMLGAFKECADFAANYGVMVVFQNHNDFIKSAADTRYVMEQISSDWFGLMVDIGSVPSTDPYDEIASLIPWAVTWQIKEHVTRGQDKVPTDFKRLMKIVQDASYQGYFPLETLGEGDPVEKVRKLYQEVTSYMI